MPEPRFPKHKVWDTKWETQRQDEAGFDVKVPRPFFVLFMPATEQPRVLEGFIWVASPGGTPGGTGRMPVLPPCPYVQIKSNGSQRPLRHWKPEVIAGCESESIKDDKRLAGLRRLRQPFWLGHGPDGTKWGAGVNL